MTDESNTDESNTDERRIVVGTEAASSGVSAVIQGIGEHTPVVGGVLEIDPSVK
ncbi:hypothetical protein ACWDRR_43525 [Kitasatospora sp. NPDC003701]